MLISHLKGDFRKNHLEESAGPVKGWIYVYMLVSFQEHMGVEPKIGVKPPKWIFLIMENPIKMDDLGVPLFSETSISLHGPVTEQVYLTLGRLMGNVGALDDLPFGSCRNTGENSGNRGG